MSNTTFCATCVSLDQQYRKLGDLFITSEGPSRVRYASERKAIEGKMWEHVKVCKD